MKEKEVLSSTTCKLFAGWNKTLSNIVGTLAKDANGNPYTNNLGEYVKNPVNIYAVWNTSATILPTDTKAMTAADVQRAMLMIQDDNSLTLSSENSPIRMADYLKIPLGYRPSEDYFGKAPIYPFGETTI
jgi:hypothetical protein